MAQRIVMRGSIVLVRYPFTDLTNTKAGPYSTCDVGCLCARIGSVEW